jgi:hypothetical protein
LGYITLERKFRAVDVEGSKLVTLAEFKHAARSMNFPLGDVELRQLFEHFDAGDARVVDYEVFKRGVREPLSGPRADLVKVRRAPLSRPLSIPILIWPLSVHAFFADLVKVRTLEASRRGGPRYL